MDKKLLLVMVAILQIFSVFGQAPKGIFGQTPKGISENSYRIINYMHEISKKPNAMAEGTKIDLAEIEGSMYYTEDFTLGDVYYRNKVVFNNVPMRYNAYNDEVEIKRATEEDAMVLLKNSSTSCAFNNEGLIYSEYTSKKGDLEHGYMVQLFSGKKYLLYEKRSKVFKEGQKAKTSFHIPAPNKFVDKNEFFVTNGAEAPRHFSTSKKGLAIFFGEDNMNDIKAFIKKNKIDLNKREDLVRLIIHAETIENYIE